MLSEGTLQDRLHDSYSGFHVLRRPGYLPPDLQKRFDTMMAAWSRDPDPSGEVGKVPITLQNMNDHECLQWIDEILSLYTAVVKLEAKNKQD
jgi:hypothetical protein